MKKTNGIFRAAIVVVAASIVGKVLAFGREMIIARYYGISADVDAYLVAFILPVFFANIIGVALCTVLIPFMAEYSDQKEEKDLESATNLLLIVISLVFFGVSIMIFFLAPVLVEILGPGFSNYQKTLSVQLMRIMAPGMCLFVVGFVFAAFLNIKRRFFVAAFQPALLNGVIIIGAVFFYHSLGIFGLAWATVIGGIVQLCSMVYEIRKLSFRFRWILDWKNPIISRVLYLVWPVFIVSAVFQVNVMVDRMVASTLAEGSIAALNYANRIAYLPQGLIIAGIITAIYPTLSDYGEQKSISEIKKLLSTAINNICFIAIPASIGLMILGQPIVELLFQRGAFDQNATLATNKALFFYSSGIVAYALNDLFTRVFFSLKNTRTPMKIGVVAVILNIILNIILSRFLFHAGLALATALACFFQLMLFVYLLHKCLGSFIERKLINDVLRILSAAMIMGIVSFISYQFFCNYFGRTEILNLALSLTGTVLVSIIVYCCVCYCLNIRLFKQ